MTGKEGKDRIRKEEHDKKEGPDRIRRPGEERRIGQGEQDKKEG
jgi:hypothetical protein